MSIAPVRVLIVDDSVVVRKLVTEILQAEPGITVSGAVQNGKIALARIPQLNPDLITMDVEMPEMNGIEAVKEIRKSWPRLPVIMFSTLTKRGAEAALDAMAAGATDYVCKPGTSGSLDETITRIKTELVPKIRVLVPRILLAAPNDNLQVIRELHSRKNSAAPEILVVGCSTGGPNALAQVVQALPENFRLPVVVVQHMPPVFTKTLAERLNSKSAINVVEAQAGDEVRPGTVYIAPGNFHITLHRKGTHVAVGLNQTPPENSCRPAVDVLFRSAADLYGETVLALVMTGMGYDGWRGSEAIKASGGLVFAQDEASSVVWGMPGQVVRNGLADKVIPLSAIAGELINSANKCNATLVGYTSQVRS